MLAELDLSRSTGMALQQRSAVHGREAFNLQELGQNNYWLFETPTGGSQPQASGLWLGVGFSVSFAEISLPATGITTYFKPFLRILVEAGVDWYFRSHLSDVWLDSLPDVFRKNPDESSEQIKKTHVATPGHRTAAVTGMVERETFQLCHLSGLNAPQMATILGITKQTYYDWLSGKAATSGHRERLLQVLTLIEEAAERLGTPDMVSTWLLKPVAPGERSPLKLLTDHQDNLFRAALLQSKTLGRMARPLAPRPSRASLRTEQEVQRIGRQRRRTAQLEDYD